MKILFVTAPELNRRSRDSVLMPAASLYLTAKLRETGHTVDQVDLDAAFVERVDLYASLTKHPFVLDHSFMTRALEAGMTDPELNKLAEQLVAPVIGDGYDLIAVSGRRAPGAAMVVRLLRRRFGVPIIVGGDVDVTPAEFMKMVPEADYFGMGMGEGPLPELVEAIEGHRALKDVRNLIFRKHGGLITIHGIDVTINERAVPDPIGLDINPYLFQQQQSVMVPNPGARLVAPIQFIQGCPFNCSFCQVAADKRSKVYRKDPEGVVDEIHRLASLGIGDFAFLNNTLFAGRTYPRKVAEAISNRGLSIRWSDSASFTNLDDSSLGALRDSGCISLTYGLESASPDVLGRMQRKYSPQKASMGLKATFGAGIWTQVNVITGFPGETQKDYEATARFVEEHAEIIGALAVSPFYLVNSQMSKDPGHFGIGLRTDRKGMGSRHSTSSIAFDELIGERLTYEEHEIVARQRAGDLMERYHLARGHARGIGDLMELHDVFTYIRDVRVVRSALRNDVLRFILFTGAICTNHCKDCPFSDSPAWVTRRGLDELIQAATHARNASYGRILLAGGEPTARPDFPDLMRAIQGLNFREVVLETDGSWIDSRHRAEQLRDWGVTRILFKIQGDTAGSHDDVVGRGGGFRQIRTATAFAREVGLATRQARPGWLGALSPCMSRSRFHLIREANPKS